MLSTGLSFIFLLVCLCQCQQRCNHLDAFACGFNKRTYRSNHTITTLSFASTVEYQLLRLDYELFIVGKNNCTNLDGRSTIHCTTEVWNSLKTIIFEIRDISRYREISLHSKKNQDFDQISFHEFPHPKRFYGDFIYTEADNFDICTPSDEVELTWQVNGTQVEEVVVECWHHDMKICSKPTYSPDDQECHIKEFVNFFEVKIVAKQGVAKMDNYVCTLNGGRSLSKAVYWQVPLLYQTLESGMHFEGQDSIIVSLEEDRKKNLTESVVRHGWVKEEFLKHDEVSLAKVEDQHIMDSFGIGNGPHCTWEKSKHADNTIHMKATCRIFSLSYTVQEQQLYEGTFPAHSIMTLADTQRFMYHQMDGLISYNEAMLYFVVDTKQTNITNMKCRTGNDICDYPVSLEKTSVCKVKVVGDMVVYAMQVKRGHAKMEIYFCKLNENFVLRKAIFWEGLV